MSEGIYFQARIEECYAGVFMCMFDGAGYYPSWEKLGKCKSQLRSSCCGSTIFEDQVTITQVRSALTLILDYNLGSL